MKRVERSLAAGATLALSISACSLAPPLKTPDVPTADDYKETGPWTKAEPADQLGRDSWWRLYGNAELDDLQRRLIDGNPTLAASLANYAQARSLIDQARAGLFPTLDLNSGVSRARESVHAPLISNLTPRYYDDNTLGGSVSYELDLWGQIRNEGGGRPGPGPPPRRGSRERAPVADRTARGGLYSTAQFGPRQRDSG
jgi:outer membrane protein TolC